jgi:hypothetical protein
MAQIDGWIFVMKTAFHDSYALSISVPQRLFRSFHALSLLN